MLKLRFLCSDENDIRWVVNQKMTNDFPERKSIWGFDLYRAGIHFTKCNEVIKGFYLDESESESIWTRPRVSFTGRFVRKDDNLFFDIYIYPRIIEFIFLIVAFISVSSSGPIGFIVSAIVLVIFFKSYYDMMKQAYQILQRLFS